MRTHGHVYKAALIAHWSATVNGGPSLRSLTANRLPLRFSQRKSTTLPITNRYLDDRFRTRGPSNPYDLDYCHLAAPSGHLCLTGSASIAALRTAIRSTRVLLPSSRFPPLGGIGYVSMHVWDNPSTSVVSRFICPRAGSATITDTTRQGNEYTGDLDRTYKH